MTTTKSDAHWKQKNTAAWGRRIKFEQRYSSCCFFIRCSLCAHRFQAFIYSIEYIQSSLCYTLKRQSNSPYSTHTLLLAQSCIEFMAPYSYVTSKVNMYKIEQQQQQQKDRQKPERSFLFSNSFSCRNVVQCVYTISTVFASPRKHSQYDIASSQLSKQCCLLHFLVRLIIMAISNALIRCAVPKMWQTIHRLSPGFKIDEFDVSLSLPLPLPLPLSKVHHGEFSPSLSSSIFIHLKLFDSLSLNLFNSVFVFYL